MQEFKHDHFAKSHPGAARIQIEPLPTPTLQQIRKTLEQRLVHVDPDDALALVRQIRVRSVLVPNVNAATNDFRLEQLLWQLRIHPESEVFVNWDRFDTVDQIATSELTKYFCDIWYPSSDDVEIFDRSFNWVLSITHTGDVRLTKL